MTKRQRTRGFIACEACQRRKSRCELLNAEGCHRCRTLRTSCSLAPRSSSTSDVQTRSTLDSPVDTSLTRVGSSGGSAPPHEAWMRRIENMLELALNHGEYGQSLPHRPRHGELDGAAGDEPAVKELLQRSLGTSLLMVTALNIHDRSEFVCPVEQGLVSWSRFCSIHSTFLSRIAPIAPLRYLLPDPEALSDPFLRACIVDHVLAGDAPSSEAMRRIIAHNLTRLKSANPSIPLIQGLLVLSLRPLARDEQRLPRKPDEEDYLSRAVSMALAFGLDDAPRRALQAGTHNLQSEVYRGVLQQTLLWYTLIHRSSWTDIFSTPAFTCRPFATPLISEVFCLDRWTAYPLVTHLVLEAQYFGIVSSLSAEFQAMRIEEYQPPRMTSIENAWQDLECESAAWRERVRSSDISSANWLRGLSLALQILIPFKLTTDMRVCIASPIKHDEIFALFERLVPNIFHFSQAFISHCVVSELLLPHAPRFLLTLCVMPYATVTQVARLHDTPLDQLSPHAPAFRRMLSSAHPALAAVLDSTDKRPPPTAWKQSATTGDDIDEVPGFLVEEFLRWIESDL